MAFCTECGTNVPDDMRFCTVCGKQVAGGPAPQPATPPQAITKATAPVQAVTHMPPAQPVQPVQPTPQAQAVAYQAVPRPQMPLARAPDAAPPKGSKYAVMGTGAYFGTMLLFCIPVIGWVACIVMAFAGNGLNRKNFARAMLIFLVIGIALSVALYFVSSWVLEVLLETYAAQSGLYGLAG